MSEYSISILLSTQSVHACLLELRWNNLLQFPDIDYVTHTFKSIKYLSFLSRSNKLVTFTNVALQYCNFYHDSLRIHLNRNSVWRGQICFYEIQQVDARNVYIFLNLLDGFEGKECLFWYCELQTITFIYGSIKYKALFRLSLFSITKVTRRCGSVFMYN